MLASLSATYLVSLAVMWRCARASTDLQRCVRSWKALSFMDFERAKSHRSRGRRSAAGSPAARPAAPSSSARRTRQPARPGSTGGAARAQSRRTPPVWVVLCVQGVLQRAFLELHADAPTQHRKAGASSGSPSERVQKLRGEHRVENAERGTL